MKNMIVLSGWSSPDGHLYLKCKRCEQEFYVVSAAKYCKEICFCPYCGQFTHEQSVKKYKETEEMI